MKKKLDIPSCFLNIVDLHFEVIRCLKNENFCFLFLRLPI